MCVNFPAHFYGVRIDHAVVNPKWKILPGVIGWLERRLRRQAGPECLLGFASFLVCAGKRIALLSRRAKSWL